MDAQTPKTKPHSYPPEKQQWLLQQTGRLQWKGLAYSNPQTCLPAYAMAISKGDSFRLEVDYRTVHQQLEVLLAETRRTTRVTWNQARQKDDYKMGRQADWDSTKEALKNAVTLACPKSG